MKVLVADPLHQEGVDLLEAEPDVTVDIWLKMKPEELVVAVADYDALIVRSESRVTADVIEAGTNLRVIGRAGVGVDNIDLETATRKGIAVVYAPTGNTIAAAEHTIALMMSMSRHIVKANASMLQEQWNRSQFMGVEVKGKTLGVIGLGRVGSEVAKRALGLEMQVLGYDPYLVPERAARLGVKIAEFDVMLATCDFLTLHTPLTDTTKSLIGAREMGLMKPTARIINVARGGLVDEDALILALDDEKLAGAAIDVFPKEPLEDYRIALHPKIVATPHLGASTMEAQAAVTREVVEQVLTVLKGKPARFTVNVPFVAPEVQDLIEPFLDVAATVGKVAIQLANGQPNSVTIEYQGELAGGETGTLKAAVLMGILQLGTEDRINLVNAAFLAEERGLKVTETKDTVPQQFTNEITVRLATTGGEVIVGGTHLRGHPHVTRIGKHLVDAAVDSPYLLIIENDDRPGGIGSVGSIAAKHDINISFMVVGRVEARGKATMVVGLDDPMNDSVLAELKQNPAITSARLVRM